MRLAAGLIVAAVLAGTAYAAPAPVPQKVPAADATPLGSWSVHFGVSYSDNEGRTWRLGFVANHTRGWFGGYEDLVVDTNPASPNFGALYLACNWPKDRARGT